MSGLPWPRGATQESEDAFTHILYGAYPDDRALAKRWNAATRRTDVALAAMTREEMEQKFEAHERAAELCEAYTAMLLAETAEEKLPILRRLVPLAEWVADDVFGPPSASPVRLDDTATGETR